VKIILLPGFETRSVGQPVHILLQLRGLINFLLYLQSLLYRPDLGTEHVEFVVNKVISRGMCLRWPNFFSQCHSTQCPCVYFILPLPPPWNIVLAVQKTIKKHLAHTNTPPACTDFPGTHNACSGPCSNRFTFVIHLFTCTLYKLIYPYSGYDGIWRSGGMVPVIPKLDICIWVSSVTSKLLSPLSTSPRLKTHQLPYSSWPTEPL